MYKRINELLGTEYKNDSEIDWEVLSYKDKILPESFMEEFSDKLVWASISSYQILSEDFIRKYKNRVNWRIISCNQILSWDFMLEFKDKLDWNYISLYQPFIDPSSPMIDRLHLLNNESSKLYQKTKDKGWFIGFKEVSINKYEFPGFYYFSYGMAKFRNYRFQKIKIYWKDLIKLSIVKKYEPIRLIKRL